MIDLNKLYEDFLQLLNSFTDEDLDEWLKMDEERMSSCIKE